MLRCSHRALDRLPLRLGIRLLRAETPTSRLFHLSTRLMLDVDFLRRANKTGFAECEDAWRNGALDMDIRGGTELRSPHDGEGVGGQSTSRRLGRPRHPSGWIAKGREVRATGGQWAKLRDHRAPTRRPAWSGASYFNGGE
jgi:hypothetical protein